MNTKFYTDVENPNVYEDHSGAMVITRSDKLSPEKFAEAIANAQYDLKETENYKANKLADHPDVSEELVDRMIRNTKERIIKLEKYGRVLTIDEENIEENGYVVRIVGEYFLPIDPSTGKPTKRIH